MRIIFVTPFDKSIADLGRAEQLILLKGCVLCQITRDVANESGRNKPEWKTCKAELGLPTDTYTVDVIGPALREAIGDRAPSTVVETDRGRLVEVLDADALARCKGSVQDFRGRLLYRLAALDLKIPFGDAFARGAP